ncbi:hypothetical protein PVAND_015038 [Polypedilum vanderplanki]|uniref:Transmembrane protein n=1 Tax=Polypedilum vanderplanki TaxID=319348 RepID=A0A9J6BBF8_POLVA|nr:hypothetical protein PVAND_015038 [Polypedilum vanderplanki]
MVTYICLVNSCYIAVLMMILNSYNVLVENMSGYEKLEMLLVASLVNFLCYYLFASLLLVLAVNERQSQGTNFFLMIHGASASFIFLSGLVFANIFSSYELLSFIIFDFFFRLYGFFTIFYLSKKFRNEEHEANLAKFTEFVNLLNSGGSFTEGDQRTSYCETYENGVRNKRDSNILINI